MTGCVYCPGTASHEAAVHQPDGRDFLVRAHACRAHIGDLAANLSDIHNTTVTIDRLPEEGS